MKRTITKVYHLALLHRAWILSIVVLAFALTLSERSTIEFVIAMLGGSLVQASLKSYSSGNERLQPPLNAEFLFYLFYNQKKCDALVGDLEERYRKI